MIPKQTTVKTKGKAGPKKKKEKLEDIGLSICIPLHVYPFHVVFSFNHSSEDLKKIIHRKEHVRMECLNDHRIEYGSGGGAKWALYLEDNRNVALVRMKIIPSTAWQFSALAHEISHVTFAILETCGLSLNVGTSDEAYAYVISYLTQEVYEALNKYY